ncbi:CDP-alcohol phosphatidyltransferase family protein [Endozoicomonas sp. SCSIO W0465]|uniref:CDP-alcohol phosphatidyltransferase family protein n=1 Tax=Endozoicomonas sp. SCSIO W0465 TaxID=2918516 RepID=UPI0020751F05|nr:CDP-alcohol phosphatidyltransferase family protein [Endozoicomonas sp. SCSIO W0465]USE39664.1 CDP-alcohol phosphatidyltransferase family protein [Endozoicomonas sp. SCSIO W0465]
MLDKWTTPLIQPALKLTALWLKRHGIKPNQVTITGFLIGMIALPLLASEYYSLALLLILGNRIMDGLDGALARLASPSDAGGFLDITLDFIFYSGIVLGFALAAPAKNAVAACVLIFSFMGTGASFLAYAIMAEKHQLPDPNFKHKSLYYLGGLAEGTETIFLFILFCLLPGYFPQLALGFAAICMLTAALRVWSGYHSIDQAEKGKLKDSIT